MSSGELQLLLQRGIFSIFWSGCVAAALLVVRPRPVRLETVHEQQLALGETLDLGRWQGQSLVARIEVTPTLAGKMANLLFQTPPVRLETRTKSGVAGYLFIPVRGDNGFLLSPALITARDLADFYENRLQGEVSVLTLSIPPLGHGAVR